MPRRGPPGYAVWTSPRLVAGFLRDVRGAIPFAADQIALMLRLLAAAGRPIRRVLDLGAGDGVLADAVVSGLAIHHLPNPAKRRVYRAILALLAPGGMFVNIEHVAPTSPWGERAADDHFIDALHRRHRERGGRLNRTAVARFFRHRQDKRANILAPAEAQCAWLRRLGYVDVDCYFKSFDLAVFGGRRPGR